MSEENKFRVEFEFYSHRLFRALDYGVPPFSQGVFPFELSNEWGKIIGMPINLQSDFFHDFFGRLRDCLSNFSSEALCDKMVEERIENAVKNKDLYSICQLVEEYPEAKRKADFFWENKRCDKTGMEMFKRAAYASAYHAIPGDLIDDFLKGSGYNLVFCSTFYDKAAKESVSNKFYHGKGEGDVIACVDRRPWQGPGICCVCADVIGFNFPGFHKGLYDGIDSHIMRELGINKETT